MMLPSREEIDAMVAEYGMSRTLGPRRFGRPTGEPFLGKDFSSESAQPAALAASVDSEVDRLVREGRSFTDAHTSSAVCSPTRYGLLTGRYN